MVGRHKFAPHSKQQGKTGTRFFFCPSCRKSALSRPLVLSRPSVNANRAALTARAGKRRGPPGRAFASFFKRKSCSKKRGRGEQNDRKTTHHLGRTTAGC